MEYRLIEYNSKLGLFGRIYTPEQHSKLLWYEKPMLEPVIIHDEFAYKIFVYDYGKRIEEHIYKLYEWEKEDVDKIKDHLLSVFSNYNITVPNLS